MTKKIIILLLIAILGVGYYLHFNWKTGKINTGSRAFFQRNTPTPSPRAMDKTKSVFVPYWARLNDLNQENYDRYYYFGVGVNEQGVIKDDAGYTNMPAFTSYATGKEKWLTVRMLDHDVNTEILQNSSTWVGIAHDIAITAQENGFDGVILDLEVGLISFHIAPDTINGFTETVAHEVHQNNMKLGMTIYGDTSFRKRPYDVKTLATHVDEILIMAYDFHKSFGEAGPNFPLNGVDTYQYAFTTMVDDFTSVVPPEKISIIYGMYGYEWIIDNQNRTLKAATALTLHQIRNRFLNGCNEKDCLIQRDNESSETKILFKDDQGRQHVVWFEDEGSVKNKQDAALKKGIGSSGFWAYGYF